MSIVSSSDVLDFLDNPSDTDIVTMLHESVEEWVKQYCRRDFESTTYSKERYDGTGTTMLTLRNYPVVSVDRLAIGTLEVIKICNTAEYTTATVSVTSTGLRLVKDGSVDSSVTFASNTTMTAVVNAVNALGSGWSAELLSSDYGNYASTELLKMYGKNCIDSNWVDLLIPNSAEDDLVVYENEGMIYYPSKFPTGHGNVIVDYVAGYSSDDMPDDLQLAIKVMIKHMYQKRDEESFSASSFKTGDYSVNLLDMPAEVKEILSKYKRYMV